MDLDKDFSVLAGDTNGSGAPEEAYVRAILNLCERLYGSTQRDASWESSRAFLNGEPDRILGATLPTITSATLISTVDSREPDVYPEVLAKASLYSDMMVLVVPETLHTMTTSYSAAGWLRDYDTAAVRRLMSLNRQYSDMVRNGRCLFMPERMTYLFSSMSEEVLSDYAPPFALNSHEDPFVPLDRRSPLLDSREMFLYKHILLPYFPGLDLLSVSKLRTDETDSFIRFSTFLWRRVRALADAQSVGGITEIIEEIEYEVSALRLEAKKLEKTRSLRDVKMALFSVSLGAMVLGSAHPAVQAASGFIGSVAAIDLLKELSGYRREQIDLRKSDFYIPYLLSSPNDGC